MNLDVYKLVLQCILFYFHSLCTFLKLIICCCRQQCVTVIFFLWRAPQQMLRKHLSLEAYCATLWWRWLVFSFFLVMEHRWNEIDREEPKYSGKNLPLCQPQIPHGLTRDRARASAVRGRRLTAWAMARPLLRYCIRADPANVSWVLGSACKKQRIGQYRYDCCYCCVLLLLFYCILFLCRTSYLNTDSVYVELSDIYSNFRVESTFVIVDLQTLLHARCADIHVYVCDVSHTPT
jgi:hypothetical protein